MDRLVCFALFTLNSTISKTRAYKNAMKQGISNFTRNACNLAWLALMIATGIGWWFGQSGHQSVQGINGSTSVAITGVIVTAMIKVWIVGVQFMELRSAPRWLRHGFDAWVVGICSALVIISTQQ